MNRAQTDLRRSPSAMTFAEAARAALRRRERLLFGIAGVLTLLAAWEIGTRTGYLNTLFFSSPSEVLRTAQGEINRGTIWAHVWISVAELVVGVTLGFVIGVVIGFSAGWFRHANYVLDPWITVLYSTPKVALVPLIILLFGIDFAAKVFVVALMSIFSVTVNTMIGVQTARGPLLEVARGFGASEVTKWRTVVLPTSTPFILSGLRLAIGHGMVGVLVAELIAGNKGLGYFIKYSAYTLNSGGVIFGIILIGAWGILAGDVVRRIEQRVEVWRPS